MNTELHIKDFVVSSTNLEELKGLKKEIFDQQSYYFETNNPNPIIIDLGAHVGLSSIYFASLYPTAQILALEPNPDTFKLLQHNLTVNSISNVTALNLALATKPGKQTLFIDTQDDWFSTASFTKGAWNHTQTSEAISVETTTLANLLNTYFPNQSIDLVKMDIEGAEHQIIPHAGQELSRIKHLIMEYHPAAKYSLFTIAERLKKFNLLPDEPLITSPKKLRQLQLLHFTNTH